MLVFSVLLQFNCDLYNANPAEISCTGYHFFTDYNDCPDINGCVISIQDVHKPCKTILNDIIKIIYNKLPPLVQIGDNYCL